MVVQSSVSLAAETCSQMPMVLVIDDDDDSLTLMAYILEQLACQACFVADGLGALAAVQRHRPQLILSDIYLPHMDGFGLLRQLRANRDTCHIPVVAVTALAAQGDREKILSAGFDDYISKPFLIEPLEKVVQRFITLPQQALT